MDIREYGTFERAGTHLQEIVSDVKPVRPQTQIQAPVHTPAQNVVQTSPAAAADSQSKPKTAPKSKVKVERTVGAFHSLGTKLIAIISVVFVVALGLVTFLCSSLFGEDTRINAEENNLVINRNAASDCEDKIDSVISSTAILLDMLSTDAGDEVQIKADTESFFERNRDIVAVSIVKGGIYYRNRSYFLAHELSDDFMENFCVQEEDAVNLALNGTNHIQNASPSFGEPVLALFFPIEYNGENDAVAVVFKSDELNEAFSQSTINSCMFVNGNGIVLAHSDVALVNSAADLSSNKFVTAFKDSFQSEDNAARQTTYVDDDGEEYIAIYKRLANCDAGVITEVNSRVVYSAVQKTVRLIIYIAVAVLALTILIIRFYGRSIAKPLELLTAVANEISKGNFDTPLFDELKEKRRDEIGVLNRSTKDEKEILHTVTSLTNKGVAKAIVRKAIDFEPHLKDITIFFSDIRGFTAISDGFSKRFGEKSAAEIISFLNDYMGRMVNCISATGGNVDKFEGDAIMACWGVLRDDDLSFEQMDDSNPEKEKLASIHNRHIRHDTISAIRSTIGMRYALMKYNKDAEAFTKEHALEPLAKYKPHIQIGCGLNVGRATVGFMGSTEKMEFTSIGDAVNLASRTESSNKPCGTDILISQDTYDLLKHDYIRCKENNYTISDAHLVDEIVVEQIPVEFEVKGKGKQHFYGVVNMPAFNIESFFKRTEKDFVVDTDCARACGPSGPKTLNEVRKLLGIPVPDFGSVNLNAEENKVKIS